MCGCWCAGDRLEVAGMELTQSRSGDIQGYSLGDGTEHLLLPNPVKAENMYGRLHHYINILTVANAEPRPVQFSHTK